MPARASYDRAEEAHQPDRDLLRIFEGPSLTVTQARQGVRGHKVSTVLAVSLFLVAIAGGVFLAWISVFPTSFGRQVPPQATANNGK
jgi:hypothetical protein